MLVPMVAACSEKDRNYGAQINMYLANEVYNLDPAYAHLDQSALKLCSLLFEGLTRIDEDGDVEEVLIDDWDYVHDEKIKEDKTDDTYIMTIELIDSAWSDGRSVHADQFVYAWKRLLDPDFYGEGAELLYDIKGAYDRKVNMKSPDDIGLTADKKILTIEFAYDIDPEEFLRKCASIALVPLREDAVTTYKDWSSASSTLISNGPFTVGSYTPGVNMQLVRNFYYCKDITDDDYVDPTKYVNPYLINIDFNLNGKDMMKKFDNGDLFYISELPCDKATREKYAKQAEITNTLCTHTYYFNTNKAPFNIPEVRKALSDVIDRNAIVKEVVFAYAATGIVPNGVADKSGDFAKNNTNKITATAAKSVSEAKTAIVNAIRAYNAANAATPGFVALSENLSSYDLNLTVKCGAVSAKDGTISNGSFVDTIDAVVAEMVIDVWDDIFPNFEIQRVSAEQYKEATSALVQRKDMLVNIMYGTYGQYSYWTGNNETGSATTGESWDRGDQNNAADNRDPMYNFDVVAIDYQMLMDNAFSALSIFAANYSGSNLSTGAEPTSLGHITGYNNATINTLIDEANAARIKNDTKTLYNKLHEVEKILLNEMPVIPIFVYKEAVLIHDDLSDVEFDYFNAPNFNGVDLKNWEDHLPSDAKDEDKKK